MMRAPIAGSSLVYEDNMSIIYNNQRPDSTLKKNSNSVCYHVVGDSVAMNEIQTAHVASRHTKTGPTYAPRLYLMSRNSMTW